MSALVELVDLEKTYPVGGSTFYALRGVSLQVQRGDFVAIMGPSGSGKSTLLHLTGGLDRPTAGRVRVGEHWLQQMNESELARFRRANIGFVFQFFHLIDNLTVQANVELPALLLEKKNKKAIRQRSTALLERLGIAAQAHKHPWELSGGQQQRVAIARALINSPTLLLGDEPTGNLDSASGQEVLHILEEFNALGQTILMVTHDAVAASRARHVLFIRDGLLVDALPGGDAQRIARRVTELQ